MICTNCGTECESKFCPNCGTEMKQLEVERIIEEVIESEEQSNFDEYNYDTTATAKDTQGYISDKVDETVSDYTATEKQCSDETISIKKDKPPIASKTWFVILMLLIFFPVGVYLMWKQKKFKKALRIILSIILGIWFAFWALIFVALLIPCDHSDTDTYTYTEPTLTEAGVEVEYCTICDEELDSWETDVKEPYVYDTAFNFGDEEFIDWVNEISAAEVGSEDLELSGMGEENTSYRVVMPEGDVGAIILRHDEYDDVCAIMVYFEEYEPAVALATFIGNKIDSSFSAESAFSKLVFDKPYVAADMTITRVNLDTDFEVTLLAPTEYVADLFE